MKYKIDWGIMRRQSFVTKLIFICALPFLVGLRFIDDLGVTQKQSHTLCGFSRFQIEQDIAAFSPKERKHLDTMARTIYGEARGENDDHALLAVAHVILNRTEHKNWGTSPKKVVLEPSQFSCWNQRDPNRPLLECITLDDPHFRRAYRAAIVALKRSDDFTNGATHYHSIYLKRKPKWAKNKNFKPIGQFGRHEFYKF